MAFGLTIEKLLLIGLIAVMIIGPERLPAAAESLRRTIQQVRRMARTAQERVREELGPEVADVDWQRLDPRQYDPRRIIREALLTESEPPPVPGVAVAPRGAEEPAVPAPVTPVASETQSASVAGAPESRSAVPGALEAQSASVAGAPAADPVEAVPDAAPSSARVGTAPPR